jgi:hypothetical protein
MSALVCDDTLLSPLTATIFAKVLQTVLVF